MPNVHVDDFGAVGDYDTAIANGVEPTENSSAIRNAYIAASGGIVEFGPLAYGIGKTILINNNGGHLRGTYTANNPAGTSLVAMNDDMDMIKITKHWNSSVKGFYLRGEEKARTGIWAFNSGQNTIENVIIWKCKDAGILLDHTPHDGLDKGNNNRLRLINVTGHYNGDGIRTQEGNDNNIITVENCNFGSNKRFGILVKGESWIIKGGIYEANGSHAIQLSEPTDQGHTTGCIIQHPWIEMNGHLSPQDGTKYGIRGGGKSVRNTIYLDGGMPFSNAPGSFDILVTANASLSGMYEVRGGFGASAYIAPGTSSVVYGSDGTKPDIPVYIRPKNAPIHLNDINGQGVTIGGGLPIKKHSSATMSFSAEIVSQQISTVTIPIPDTLPGDTVLATHDKLNTLPIMISAHVQVPGVVQVNFYNPSQTTVEILPGTLRADVWKH